MINDEPSTKEMAALWALCMEFIVTHNITCAESIYQRDKIYEVAPELVEQICDHIGYVE